MHKAAASGKFVASFRLHAIEQGFEYHEVEMQNAHGMVLVTPKGLYLPFICGESVGAMHPPVDSLDEARAALAKADTELEKAKQTGGTNGSKDGD